MNILQVIEMPIVNTEKGRVYGLLFPVSMIQI